MKKFLSILMILALALSMGTMAFAEGETFKLTISGAQGHTYEVYQIFTGSLATIDGKKTLGDVTYGENYTPGDATAGETKVPATDLEAITDAKTFAEKLVNDDLLEGNAHQTATASGETAVFEGLVPGYYVVLDVTQNLPEGEAPSAIIVQVVGDATIASKHGTVEIEKKVDDKNDSNTTEDGEEWIDSADYDIGDTVPFKSESTFNGLDKYTTYEVCFTDIMSPGLTYAEDLKIYLGEDDVTSHFEISFSEYNTTEEAEAAYNGGTTITASCDDIKAFVGNSKSATFVLKYSAVLNDEANLGAPGNPNKIKLTGNPDGRGEFETPWDIAIVFTYKLNVDKYKNEVAEGNKLNGAGFTLYKWQIVTPAEGDTPAVYDWVAVGEEIVGEEMSNFVWKGIDDGKYKLEETTTPDGYNTIEPMYFEVTATHDVLSDTPALKTLQANGKVGDLETGEAISFTNDVTEGSLSTDIINKSGIELPETGGIGTTLFYLFGGCLVLGAIVLLITKKRMKNAEN